MTKILEEFELISHLTKSFKPKQAETLRAIGDDAAVVSYNGMNTLVTTDLLLEGIHFDLMFNPLKHLGYKAVAVNISDICAMNGIAKQITVSIGVSSRFSTEDLEQLYDGIKTACDIYDVDLIGGDTSASLTGLTISITALGVQETDKISYRNNAKSGDLICVSGDLGSAYAGLNILVNSKKEFEKSGNQPDISKYKYCVERQLKPEARIDIIKKLDEMEIVPSSMIDISDGLSSELTHICKQSNVGCYIYQKQIPIAKETAEIAELMQDSAIGYAFNGGEDYELLFTVPSNLYEKISTIEDIHIIGYITNIENSLILKTLDEKELPIKAKGWNALK